MKHERYIIDEAEIALLDHFDGILNGKDPNRYDNIPADSLALLCALKDRSNDMYFRRTEAARTVIDLVARVVGIDPDNTDLYLYAPDIDGKSRITDIMQDWISRGGEKAQLKKRVQELEAENAVLRSLVGK